MSLRRNRRTYLSLALALAMACAVALLSPLAGARAASVNQVPNPSLERRAGAKPHGWQQIASGSNARTFRHLYGGAADGKRFVRTTVTKRRSGYAGWSFAPVAVRGGSSYTYGDRYRSNTRTALRAKYINASGRVTYRTFAAAPPTKGWQRAGLTFNIPRGTVRMSIERLLTSRGVLDVDATQLRLRSAAPATKAPAPQPKATTPANRSGGLVSITFDDGVTNQYTDARPVLAANGFPATFYLISDYMGSGPYMSVAQAKQLQAAGHEIGSHSATHANLTQLSSAQLSRELAGSKKTLEASFGTIRSLAYPYGATNDAVAAQAAATYQTARTTNGGLNRRGSINRSNLTMKYVLSDTTAATVSSWMKEAADAGAWTILVYHGVTEGGDSYSVTPAQFRNHMAAVKTSRLPVRTVSAAYAAVS